MLNSKQRWLLCFLVSLLVLLFTQCIMAEEVYFNYAEALQKSLYFYDSNMCGSGITGGRLEWRGDCHLKDMERPYEAFSLPEAYIIDHQDIFDPDGNGYIDFSGGFHDAGDHVKFGLPQAYTASTLGWGYYEFKEAYQEVGVEDHILDILKRFSDYFLKCTFLDENGDLIAFAYMVGEGNNDHCYWGAPELQYLTEFNERPVEFAYPDEPASDQCAQASAALAIMYLNYRDIDTEYADRCLESALALYDFAREYRGHGKGDGFYPSSSYHDDLSWAAAWLYVITEDMKYIDHIYTVDESGKHVGYMSAIIEGTDDDWNNSWTHCWDDVWAGAFTRLATVLPENEMFDYYSHWNLAYWTGGEAMHKDPTNTNYMVPSPEGYACINTWGSARYNTAAQLLCLVYQKYNPEYTDLTNWARGQMEYIMGDNPMGYSYIVGYGDEYAEHPHHRAAHGSKTNSMDDPEEHLHILWGALVGGPDKMDEHVDKTSDYAYNEVAIDYNAAFVGALAGHYLLHGEGDEPIENFPPPEEDFQVYFTEAKIEQENEARTQVTVNLTCETVHPPRTVEGLSVRYFFDISELLDAGQSIDDVSFEIYYDENDATYDGPGQADGPVKWDKDSVYFVEVSWDGREIFGDREVQFGIVAAQDSNWECNWDPSNDYSREGLAEEYISSPRIPVYLKGKLVYGKEPPGTGGELKQGDLDGDGVISSTDYILLRRYLLGINIEIIEEAADMDGDGSIASSDYVLLRTYLLEK